MSETKAKNLLNPSPWSMLFFPLLVNLFAMCAALFCVLQIYGPSKFGVATVRAFTLAAVLVAQHVVNI
jgi:hypothetical protein